VKRKVRTLKISRETLRSLNPSELGIWGGDNRPPFTRTQLPSGARCDSQGDCTVANCGESVTCDSVVIC
jgi:hypothetical protein